MCSLHSIKHKYLDTGSFTIYFRKYDPVDGIFFTFTDFAASPAGEDPSLGVCHTVLVPGVRQLGQRAARPQHRVVNLGRLERDPVSVRGIIPPTSRYQYN